VHSRLQGSRVMRGRASAGAVASYGGLGAL
jgi:hypothetical protein